MKHSDGKFTGSSERAIYYQCWEPEAAPRAVLLVAHGAGEHSARYQPLAQFFTDDNFVVAALDHNGNGRSAGVPGHVDAFEEYLYDLGIFHRQIAARFPGVPMFLLGHSMGGLIGSAYLLQHQEAFVGGILSGAAIMTDPEPGGVQLLLVRLLARIAPKLGMLQLDAGAISRNPEEVRKYVDDPLVHHGKMSARMMRELLAGMRIVQTGAGEITLPMLIMHGEADEMTPPKGSCFMHEHISSRDKALKLYPGLYHEIFNEPERLEVLRDVLVWCEQRLLPA
jgi:alpha-beta hydrolase superfamily lysophospholipase